MTTDIVIRTYWRDFQWLAYCLKAIKVFAPSFRDIVLIIPQSSTEWLAQHPHLTDGVRLMVEADVNDDYLGQQVTKLYADTYTNADFICHLDADCILQRFIGPNDLLSTGRPICFTRPTAELPRHWPWTKPTQELLGWMPEFDFMQQPPFTFPRWLYGEVRAWCLKEKGVELDEWVLSRPPRGFSEFNLLGAFAYAFHRECFDWRPMTSLPRTPFCRWYWSWEGLDQATCDDLERLLAGAQHHA